MAKIIEEANRQLAEKTAAQKAEEERKREEFEREEKEAAEAKAKERAERKIQRDQRQQYQHQRNQSNSHSDGKSKLEKQLSMLVPPPSSPSVFRVHLLIIVWKVYPESDCGEIQNPAKGRCEEIC